MNVDTTEDERIALQAETDDEQTVLEDVERAIDNQRYTAAGLGAYHASAAGDYDDLDDDLAREAGLDDPGRFALVLSW